MWGASDVFDAVAFVIGLLRLFRMRDHWLAYLVVALWLGLMLFGLWAWLKGRQAASRGAVSHATPTADQLAAPAAPASRRDPPTPSGDTSGITRFPGLQRWFILAWHGWRVSRSGGPVRPSGPQIARLVEKAEPLLVVPERGRATAPE